MKQIKQLILILITFITASTMLAEEPLPVDKAFPQEINISDDLVSIKFFMRDKYYLYRHAFKFESSTDGVTLGDPIMPPAIPKYDEFLGDVEVYETPVEILIPYDNRSNAGNIVLTYDFQGCLTDSICYPPTTKTASVTPRSFATLIGTPIPEAELATEKPDALIEDLDTELETRTTAADSVGDFLSGISGVGGSEPTQVSGVDTGAFASGTSPDDILPVEKAFQLSVDVGADGYLTANWFAENGYYLYQDKLTFESSNPAITLGQPFYPEAKEKYDEIFGDTLVYYGMANIRIPILARPEAATSFTLKALYQGCKEDSICYPPSETTLPLTLSVEGAVADVSMRTGSNYVSGTTESLSETDRIAKDIGDSSLWWTILKFLGFGLALTFTPCVLPMIPILSGIITGTDEKQISPRKAFVLSVIYVLAMALVFTLVGIVAALLGQNLQAAFQNPTVIIVFSLLFVALALSMFGLYELQMPSSIQNKLTQISNNQESGSYWGAAVMGALSALIVGPCVTPPLIGAITVIAETGDATRGGLSMFALAIGMGLPMILFGTALGGLVPKAGGWMDQVKQFFGVLMLGLAVWMLSRILPPSVTLALWSVIAAMTAVVFGVFNKVDGQGLLKQMFKVLGVLALVYSAILLIGSLSNAKDPLRPLDGLGFSGQHTELEFKRIKSVDDLNASLALAASRKQNVFLDFYADWCVACLEMEKYTFSDSQVQTAFNGWMLLQADVTKNDVIDKALLKHLNIQGPPAMLFYDQQGQEVNSSRLFGFKKPGEFLPYIEALN